MVDLVSYLFDFIQWLLYNTNLFKCTINTFGGLQISIFFLLFIEVLHFEQ